MMNCNLWYKILGTANWNLGQLCNDEQFLPYWYSADFPQWADEIFHSCPLIETKKLLLIGSAISICNKNANLSKKLSFVRRSGMRFLTVLPDPFTTCLSDVLAGEVHSLPILGFQERRKLHPILTYCVCFWWLFCIFLMIAVLCSDNSCCSLHVQFLPL